MRDVLSLREDADHDRERADGERADARRANLFSLRCMLALDDADPDVVRHRRGGREHQTGDDRDDRCKRDGGDEGEEEIAERRISAAADELRQQRRREIAAAIEARDRRGADVATPRRCR